MVMMVIIIIMMIMMMVIMVGMMIIMIITVCFLKSFGSEAEAGLNLFSVSGSITFFFLHHHQYITLNIVTKINIIVTTTITIISTIESFPRTVSPA